MLRMLSRRTYGSVSVLACLARLLPLVTSQGTACAAGYTSFAYTVSFTDTQLPRGWVVQSPRNDNFATGVARSGPFQAPLFQTDGAVLTVGMEGSLDVGLVQIDPWMPPMAEADMPLIAQLDVVPDVHLAEEPTQTAMPQHQFGWIYAGAAQDAYCPISGLYVAAGEGNKIRISLRQSNILDEPPTPDGDNAVWSSATCPYIDAVGVYNHNSGSTSFYKETGTPLAPTLLNTAAGTDVRWGFTWAGSKPTPVWPPFWAWQWSGEGQQMAFGIGSIPFTAYAQPAPSTAWVDLKASPVAFMLGLGKFPGVKAGPQFSDTLTMTVSAVTLNGCITTTAAVLTATTANVDDAAFTSSSSSAAAAAVAPVPAPAPAPEPAPATTPYPETDGAVTYPSTSSSGGTLLVPAAPAPAPVVGGVTTLISPVDMSETGGTGSSWTGLADRYTLDILALLSFACLLVLL